MNSKARWNGRRYTHETGFSKYRREAYGYYIIEHYVRDERNINVMVRTRYATNEREARRITRNG